MFGDDSEEYEVIPKTTHAPVQREPRKNNKGHDNVIDEAYLAGIRSRHLLTRDEEIALGKLLEPMIHLRARKEKTVMALNKIKNKKDAGIIEQKTALEEELAEYDSMESLLRPDFEAARNTLVERNLRWAISISVEYFHKGLPINDIIQHANIGLIRAAEKFDWRFGYKFTTYATWWIKQTIRRALFSDVRSVYMPTYLYELMHPILSLHESFVAEYGYEPSAKELAARCRAKGLKFNDRPVTEEIVERVRMSGRSIISLDAPIKSDEPHRTYYNNLLQNTLSQEEQISVEDMTLFKEKNKKATELLEILTEREKNVIMWRFGFGEYEEHSLQMVADKLKLSRERVRQIEGQAIRKMRASAVGREIFRYLSQH